jgi:hypothetical protein
MTGYHLKINITNKPEDIRFRLYDNNSLVVDNINEPDFSYLVDENYSGVHTLTMTYYQEFMPSKESDKQEVYSKDFTLPTLEYTVDVSLLS